EQRIERSPETPDDAWWFIYAERRNPGAANGSPLAGATPCGMILIIPRKPAATFELFVWMRGAYRNSGLGRDAVREVLEEFRQQQTGEFRMQVRLMVSGLTGPGGKLQKRMWLTFFHHHDFVRVRSRQQAAQQDRPLPRDTDTLETEIVLERV